MKNKSFETFGISPEILKALKSLRYFNPTAVQEEVIPLALENNTLSLSLRQGVERLLLLEFLL